MKITPVKNYKKPRYAALAMAAVTTLAGCSEIEPEGIAPYPNDLPVTASEPTLSGTVTTTAEAEDITTSEKTTVTTTASYTEIISSPSLSGTVTTTEEAEDTVTSTTTFPITTASFSSSLQGTVTTADDDDDIAAEEIAEDDIVEVSTEGIVVAPEDTLSSTTTEEEPFLLEGDVPFIGDEEAVELGGDVAVEEEVGIDGEISLPEDTETFTEEGDVAVAGDDYTYEDVYNAEEFSLAGDIAVVPDYDAYDKGIEYTDEYIKVFRERGIFLAVKPGDEWGPYTVIFKDKPFILSLTGLRHDLYISFFNPEDKAFTDELKYHGMTEFEYGYYGVADVNNATHTLLFIDITSDHYNHIGEIADKMNNAGVPGTNAEQKSIYLAYESIANNGADISNITQAFRENGCELNAHTEGDHLIEYIGFEINKEVPLAFDSDTHKVYIMAFDSENPYDPILNGLEKNNAPKTEYGSVLYDEFGYTYIFLDVSKLDDVGSYGIAAAAAIEELEAK